MLRSTLPLAVIASLGKNLIGSGAFRSSVIDRDLERWGAAQRSGGKRVYDMTSIKTQLTKGKEG